MIGKGVYSRWIRLVFDSMLLVGVCLAIVAYRQPNLASARSQTQSYLALTDSGQEPQGHYQIAVQLVGTDVISNSVTLDNNSLAAMIAVENAALTSPQYLTGLPIITK